MKFLLAFLAITTIKASAQENDRILFAQFMVVFSDFDKGFEYLKGDLKTKEGSVSVFETIRSLEGTKDNVIIADSNIYQYQAVINDSTSEEGSKLILNAWKEKLGQILSGMVSPPVDFHSSKDPGTDGFEFTVGNLSMYLLRHKEENTYWINLVIKQKENAGH